QQLGAKRTCHGHGWIDAIDPKLSYESQQCQPRKRTQKSGTRKRHKKAAAQPPTTSPSIRIAWSNPIRVPMAIKQGQETVVVHSNFIVDSVVQLCVQSHDQVANPTLLGQVVHLLRILLQVVDFKVVVGDKRLVSSRTVKMEWREVS